MQTVIDQFVISRNGVPTNGLVAFRQGETRNCNPFDWQTEFSKWYQWDIEWEAAKYLE